MNDILAQLDLFIFYTYVYRWLCSVDGAAERFSPSVGQVVLWMALSPPLPCVVNLLRQCLHCVTFTYQLLYSSQTSRFSE